MKQKATWSRRGLIAATLSTLGLPARPGAAQEAEVRDRGLGGTGVVPGEPEGGDRGIGGTGVVGTIRRFGSIVVNDLRITFPPDVRVRIDGRPATVGDLRLGHVVHVLARREGAGLVTAAIAADSEVVGPIEALTQEGMVVMGQTVVSARPKRGAPWRVGQWVGVSGLRRLDGTIAASRIARAAHRDARVAGRPQADATGILCVGALPLDGLPSDAIGRRVLISGTVADGRLAVGTVESPWADLLAARPDRLSVEDYVAIDGGDVRFASGLPAVTGSGGGEASAETRAIVSAAVTPSGRIEVEGIRVEGSHGEPGARAGDHPEPGRPRPPHGAPGEMGPGGRSFGGFAPGRPGMPGGYGGVNGRSGPGGGSGPGPGGGRR